MNNLPILLLYNLKFKFEIAICVLIEKSDTLSLERDGYRDLLCVERQSCFAFELHTRFFLQ